MRLLGIAFRNLLRARRRNLLAGGTMVLGSAALVLGNGLSDGIAHQLTASLVAVQTGHLQVVARPHDFVPQNSPFDAYGPEIIPDGVDMARRVEAEGRGAGVVRAVPFLHGRGSAVAGNRSTLSTIVGIVPGREPELQKAHPPIAGVFLSPEDEGAAYVAQPVARKLRLAVGDSVSFVIQTRDGAVNSVDAVVCGIFAKGAPWYDTTFYIPLSAAQSLFDTPGGATNVKITLAETQAGQPERSRDAVSALLGQPSLPGLAGASLRVETFREAGRFSFAIVQANETALLVLSTFLFLAAAVGIVNAMLMSVHERTREIGTVRALGMRRGMVVRLFILEGLALGLVSAVLGVLLGSAFVAYWATHGIAMNTMTLSWIAGGDTLFPQLRLGSALRAGGLIALLSTVAAIYPAFTASRLLPREALHHV
jgi:putative ABC transport system permease protein